MLRQTAALIGHRFLNRRLCRILKRFRKDTDGVTAVEFAMISVPFLSLLFVIFESALMFFTQQGLEAATADAARAIMTGQTLSGQTPSGSSTALTSAAAFRSQVMCTLPSLPSFIDCNKLIIDVRNQSGFAGLTLDASFYTGNTLFQTGGANCVVVLRVVYPMPVYLNFLTMNGLVANGVNQTGQVNYDNGWKHLLLATQVFRNEPFGASGSASAPPC
ncbi:MULTISPECIES: TadE/TadG family type IV pilus assembly protein [unclassified Beijerinckia]|uniref:TadE/TadG family type IV pilus assembly protein n=1 Tax=unclassified Beijerinckia TaxID=2638183 RepID=UPI000897019A|nr:MULTISPECIES: TadE/TadG family type IV pilus assembly protein [unclassified Beijerinckia]MDH7796820.1 Flp pilus assembly protein TadG [Beijerinckia sp. GAS462]SEC61176.1 Flp pilus assembly protein TadG [Beijerinckia sp. 28-YEA-48]